MSGEWGEGSDQPVWAEAGAGNEWGLLKMRLPSQLHTLLLLPPFPSHGRLGVVHKQRFHPPLQPLGELIAPVGDQRGGAEDEGALDGGLAVVDARGEQGVEGGARLERLDGGQWGRAAAASSRAEGGGLRS